MAEPIVTETTETVETTETTETPAAAPVVATNDNSNLQWYVVNTYSGHEKKVVNQIQQRVKANGLEDQVVEVLVPTQEKVVAQGGKKKNVTEKMLPGYVMIKMEMNDQTWHLVRNTEGVTGFIGPSKKPTPLSESEVNAMIALSEVKQAAFEASFRVGDSVRIVSGNWKDFIGRVHEINTDKGQLTILIPIFGRETPVQVDFVEATTNL